MTHYPVSANNRSSASNMRKAMTDAELKPWNEIRAHRLMGLAFQRPMPLSSYIVDFACSSKKLIVELPEKTLQLTNYAPVPRAEIYLKDVMVTYDAPEKAFRAP